MVSDIDSPLLAAAGDDDDDDDCCCCDSLLSSTSCAASLFLEINKNGFLALIFAPIFVISPAHKSATAAIFLSLPELLMKLIK